MTEPLAEFPGASSPDLSARIAAAADVCRKPFLHAVVRLDGPEADTHAASLDALLDQGEDLHIRLECRDPQGGRCVDQDLELEVYRSGSDLNLMLCWWDQPERPMLWQGQHPVWMDGTHGQRCTAPQDAAPLEALTRRLRALLVQG